MRIGTKTYLGFEIRNSLFGDLVENSKKFTIEGTAFSPDTIRSWARSNRITYCLGPHHQELLDAMCQKYSFRRTIREEPLEKVKLRSGDTFIVVDVYGLSRAKADGQYTEKELASAKFFFTKYTVK